MVVFLEYLGLFRTAEGWSGINSAAPVYRVTALPTGVYTGVVNPAKLTTVIQYTSDDEITLIKISCNVVMPPLIVSPTGGFGLLLCTLYPTCL